MKRHGFRREYKLEAVKQVRERDVSSARVGRDFGISPNVVNRRVREAGGRELNSFPRHGQQHAEAAEIERLKREVIRLKVEREISRKAAYFVKESG
jgi:transposase